MTNDNEKRLETTFKNKGWSQSSSDNNVWKDKNNNVVVTRESEERFRWTGSGTTTGFSNTAKKSGN